MTQHSDELNTPPPTLFALLGGVFVLLTPAAVLIGIAVRGGPTPLLAGGIATEAFLALGLLQQVGIARASSHKSASPVYLIAVLILWMSINDHNDLFLQAGMFILVGVPLVLFVGQEFLFTGGGGLRRARALVRRLAAKSDWPDELPACKALPEVKALREALREDAEPVLVLLTHPKPQVRIAALTALEFRPSWKKGQAEQVLRAAKYASEPPVRVAAMMALANVDDPKLAATIGIYLRDAAPEVRKAAAEAMLWDAGRRWPLVRRELRAAFADPRCAHDGPLPISAALPAQVMIDLTMWSGESGPMGRRATLTLLAHYRREINQNPSSELVDELAGRIRDAAVPSALRVEFAQLLAEQDSIDGQFWRGLLDVTQPSYLRLLAAGSLLRHGADETALATLREVARVPNRAIALQVAAIVQKFLRVDMGLPLGGTVPEPHSKLAAEVARRVLDWSAGQCHMLPEERHTTRTRISGIVRHIPLPSGEHPRMSG